MKKIFLVIFFLASVFFVINSPSVLAATSSVREEAFGQLYSAAGDSGAGFSSYKDPRETVAVIIRIALGLIGTVFMVLAIYAGFVWMTAGGEQEKVTKATGILRMAIIGLIIVLMAYSLTSFIFYKVIRSTTGGSENPMQNEFCIQNPNDPVCYPN